MHACLSGKIMEVDEWVDRWVGGWMGVWMDSECMVMGGWIDS